MILFFVGLCASMLGCGASTTQILLADPFALSMSRVDGERRTLIVPAGPARIPPTNKIERAIWDSYSFGNQRSVDFAENASPTARPFIARRFDAGAITVTGRPDYQGNVVVGNEGVISLYASDLPYARIRIDRAAGELVVTMRRHSGGGRRSGARSLVDLELRTPLRNVRQIRSVRIPAFSDTRQVTITYP